MTDERMAHSVSVARLAYTIAKEKYGKSEDFARKMWVTGYCHDMGYEFAEDPKDHPLVSDEGIFLAFGGDSKAIRLHGQPVPQDFDELRILNEADLRVDGKGKVVSVEERLFDSAQRHGATSEPYRNSLWVAQELGLVPKE